MRQFGRELSYRVRAARRRLSGSARRGRRARGFVTVVTQRLVLEEGTEGVGFAPSGKKSQVSTEDASLGSSAGCPGVLGQIGWIGLDGLAVSQLFAAGAPIPSPGGFKFWFSPDKYVYQFKGMPGGGVNMRRCAWIGPVGKGVAAVSKLSLLTPAQVVSSGLG